MLLRKISAPLLTIAVTTVMLVPNERANAQVSLQGSGYWGANQGCSTKTRVGTNAISISAEEKEEAQNIELAQRDLDIKTREKKRNEDQLKLLSKKIERYFDDEIAEFLTGTHIGGARLCTDYKTYPTYNCPDPKTAKERAAEAAAKKGSVDAAPSTDGNSTTTDKVPEICGSKTSVPRRLVPNWSKGENYCTAEDDRDGGKVSSGICADASLRPKDSKTRVSVSDCMATLNDYRKRSIELENAQAKIEKYKDEIETRRLAIADAKEQRLIDAKYNKTKTEADCPQCDAEARGTANKSYLLSAVQVAAGLGLGFIGKRYDETNMEYQAQLGYPPTQGYPTAVSLGFPLVAAGVYGAVTGGSGTGGFGCASGVNGTGSIYGGGNNAYGPNGNQGGAFGYPQGYYGAPWGGGAYNPGYNPNGGFNGPNGGLQGGLNGQFGVGSPLNGLFGGANGLLGNAANGAFGIPASGQFGANGQFGSPFGQGAANGAFGGAGYPQAGYQMNNSPFGQGAVNGQFGGNGQFGTPFGQGAANGAFGGAMGGYPQAGYQMNNQFGANGQLGGQFGGQMNPQYQMQMLQQQQAQLQMQAQQAQAQYYQAQVQAQNQMIAYQRQMQVQQQAAQYQQEIYSLQQRLSMLVGSAGGSGVLGGGGFNGGYNAGGSIFGGAGISGGFSFGGAAAFNSGYNTNYNSNPGSPFGSPQATVPGVGTRTNGR